MRDTKKNLENIKNLIQLEINAINKMPIDSSFINAIDLIYEAVHIKKSKLIAAGIGKAGHIAHNIAMTLSSTGTRGVFIHPTEAQHGDLGILGEHDILLLASNSGKTREVLEFIKLAKGIYPGIRVISITGNKDSELARRSDVVLWTGGGEEIDKFKLVPTTSTTLMTIIGDMVVVSLMDKIGFTKEHYHMLHHSGYISEKLKDMK
jgi:arabinose-5-phosphate isomerase